MKRIVVSSLNPVKLRATRQGFEQILPGNNYQVEALSVPSGVGPQPRSDRATLQGAQNRVDHAVEQAPQADYWVGIEGGVEEHTAGMMAFAWIVVRSQHLVGQARTGTFFLPEPVADLVRQGKELGEADDIVFGRTNSKQQEGAIGILSGRVIDREQFYRQAVILALLPFKNAELYSEGAPGPSFERSP